MREATHAGSWYPADKKHLEKQIEAWNRGFEWKEQHSKVFICPHAGYRFSGKVANQCYRLLKGRPIKRAIIIGPSHRSPIRGAGISPFQQVDTPFNPLLIDHKLGNELLSQYPGLYRRLREVEDEDEHSLELQYPLLAYYVPNLTILPIMVGSVSSTMIHQLSQSLSPILQDPSTILVISSDFCHWGNPFDYQPFQPKWQGHTCATISEYIALLDHQGIDHIVHGDLAGFQRYLKQTQNTICGRYPIQVFLAMEPGLSYQMELVDYQQSNKIGLDMNDYSVSYVALIATPS